MENEEGWSLLGILKADRLQGGGRIQVRRNLPASGLRSCSQDEGGASTATVLGRAQQSPGAAAPS